MNKIQKEKDDHILEKLMLDKNLNESQIEYQNKEKELNEKI